jgi:pimeloyl-ACP methyl ester carboxylesterase
MSTDVSFRSADGVLLAGSLTLPRRPGDDLPAVVLIGGSGQSDRHNDGFFDDLGSHFAAAGIAVLAYDKRGAGGSSGEWATADVNLLAADATAALALLCAHPAIASWNVGLFGHSEGGWVALRAATQLAAPRHLMLNSCPALSFQRAEVYALTKSGVDQRTAATFLTRLGELAAAGVSRSQAQRVVVDDANEAIRSALAEAHFELSEQSWAQFVAWSGYDPSSDLADLAVPTLATFGETDDVTPVGESVARLQELAGPVVRTAVFANADHRLRVDSVYAPDYLDTLTEWCLGGAT